MPVPRAFVVLAFFLWDPHQVRTSLIEDRNNIGRITTVLAWGPGVPRYLGEVSFGETAAPASLY